MKVRIIKTSEGYIPQVYTKDYSKLDWHSIGTHGSEDMLWLDPEYIYNWCTYLTEWGAKRVLKKYIKHAMKGTNRLDAFKKELDQPNVVYEAEV